MKYSRSNSNFFIIHNMPAQAVLILGKSGSGKSTAIKTLPPEATFIINIASKDLPFRGWKGKYREFSGANPSGNLLNTTDADTILKTLDYISDKRPEIKYVVIEDFQYMAVDYLMSKLKETGFAKFTDSANKIYRIATKSRSLRGDLTVFILNHSQTDVDSNGDKITKAAVSGKMVENQINFEGLFTIVLYTFKEESKTGTNYGFITNGEPESTCKSPAGMFTEQRIPNDLLMVAEKIREYETTED